MGRITKIEEKLASLVERPFLNKNVFDPLNIEIAIKQRIEKEKKNILGKIMIPNKFTIIIDESVYREFEPFLEIFEKTLQKSLHQWTKEKGFEPSHRLIVQFRKGTLKRESLAVDARHEQADGSTSSSSSSSLPPPFNTSSFLPKKEDAEGLFGPSDNKVTVIGTLILLKTCKRFALNQGEIIIGRSKDCDIAIPDPTVSEIHACIYTRHGKVIIEDLGSKNGTRVNHEKVSKKILGDGDRIIIGCTEMVFRDR